jgi:hypothetical protein
MRLERLLIREWQMVLLHATQRYWKLNRSMWHLGLHRTSVSPLHVQMIEIAKEVPGSRLEEIIEKAYGDARQKA